MFVDINMAAASQIISPFVPTPLQDMTAAITPFGIGNGVTQSVEIPQAFRQSQATR